MLEYTNAWLLFHLVRVPKQKLDKVDYIMNRLSLIFRI